MKQFKQSVIEALKYYVYALVDPRDNKIFYIGKGSANRVYEHAEAAINSDNENNKLDKIREIINQGKKVQYYILRHNLNENEAYMLESAIIDFLSYPAFNTESILTNIVSGHHQWNEGIKKVDEINIMYDCKKIEPYEGDRLLLVSLNQSYDRSKSKDIYKRVNDYESACKYWRIDARKAPKINFILGVYRGIVRIVIKVDHFEKVTIGEHGEIYSPPRYKFRGEIIENSPYVNTDVTDYPFGSGGAVTYIPRDTQLWK